MQLSAFTFASRYAAGKSCVLSDEISFDILNSFKASPLLATLENIR
jgi:hypothetical protein